MRTWAAGDRLPTWEVPSVSAEKMKTMAALLGDPNPVHVDPQAVARLGLGDAPLNQGPTTMAYVANALVAVAGGPEHLLALRVRFVDAVRAGDAVVAGGTVTGVSPGTGGRLLLHCRVWLQRDGDEVLHGTATVSAPPSRPAATPGTGP